jgi:hypothetical protein
MIFFQLTQLNGFEGDTSLEMICTILRWAADKTGGSDVC